MKIFADHDWNGKPLNRAHARNTDPHTSKDAAQSITNVKGLAAKVFWAIEAAGDRGAIAKEIAAKTGIEWQTVTPRFAPLIKAGLVERRYNTDGKLIRREGQAVHWVKRGSQDIL
jgi:DNA-binding MarR family transcriptional regulator